MTIMLIMVQLPRGWGIGSDDTTPAAAHVFDR